MGNSTVKFTPLSPILHPQGDLFPGIKCSDPNFFGFGEAYFSTVNAGQIKAWRRHREMVCTLFVPIGQVKIVVWDKDEKSAEPFILGPQNYGRLMIPPGHWYGFLGLDAGPNLILNIASIIHDPNEVERKPIEAFPYEWHPL